MTVDYSYDPADRIVGLEYPTVGGARETVTYNYHSRTGRPTDADTDLSAADPVIVDGASWTASGQPVSYQLGSDTGEIVHRSWTYKDGSQRLARIRAGTGAGGDGISDFRHFYDAVGNITELVDPNHGGQHQCFSYDDLNRLEAAFTSDDCASGYNASVGTGAYEFWYDYNPIGSVMKLRDTEGGTVLADWDYGDTGVGAGAYAVDTWDPDPGPAVAIGYDESGNMISRGGDTLVFDADNRLHSYDPATGTDTGFVYDADGNRVLRIHGAITTTYVGGVYESDGTTTITYYTFAGETVGYREHTSTTDDRFYVTGDQLGSTATVIDASDVDNPVDQYYYPYGEPRTTWAISTDRAYTGQTSDHDQTGFYHYNARYYDPQLHRFTSADTIIPNPANPQTLNRYSYVGNNPLRYVDPSGHFFMRELAGGAGVAVGESTRVWLWLLTAGTGVAAVQQAPRFDDLLSQLFGSSSSPGSSDSRAGSSDDVRIPGFTHEVLQYPMVSELPALNPADQVLLLRASLDAAEGDSGDSEGDRHSPDEQTLVELVKGAKRAGGVDEKDAETLLEWADELGFDSHIPTVHRNREGSWSGQNVHIRIGRYHLPVYK